MTVNITVPNPTETKIYGFQVLSNSKKSNVVDFFDKPATIKPKPTPVPIKNSKIDSIRPLKDFLGDRRKHINGIKSDTSKYAVKLIFLDNSISNIRGVVGINLWML